MCLLPLHDAFLDLHDHESRITSHESRGIMSRDFENWNNDSVARARHYTPPDVERVHRMRSEDRRRERRRKLFIVAMWLIGVAVVIWVVAKA
jgi:hypothetical protein